jgi:hypothetical protein
MMPVDAVLELLAALGEDGIAQLMAPRSPRLAKTLPSPDSCGNHALKSALFLSAFASLADPTSRAYYDRKRAAGKRHNAALICLARRRLDVLFAMLRDKKPYQTDRTKPALAT